MLRAYLLRPSVLVAVVTCCVLVVVGAGLLGCGGTTEQAARPDIAQPAGEDVCILAGELPPEKLGAPHAAPPRDLTEKITLTVDGGWHEDSVAKGSWERHRFLVKAGNYYAVELCPIRGSGDDPDLYVSRDPDPYNNQWRVSSWARYSDLVVFKAATTGVMYAGVRGFASGADSVVDYGIRVRMCHFKQNTG